jgi:aminoglycoside-2''-adenylyltransferase
VTDREWWWEALALEEAARLMSGFPGPWWVTAGWAIELHIDRPVREHGDVDVLVLRDDQEAIRGQLPGWDFRIAHEGRLEPWPPSGRIELPRAGLWARSDATGPWQLDFLLAERDTDAWWYRRDPKIRIPLSELGLVSTRGIPYVRPEVVLLFKSRAPRERDEQDLEAVLPTLDDVSLRRLRAWLAPEHPWRTRI